MNKTEINKSLARYESEYGIKVSRLTKNPQKIQDNELSAVRINMLYNPYSLWLSKKAEGICHRYLILSYKQIIELRYYLSEISVEMSIPDIKFYVCIGEVTDDHYRSNDKIVSVLLGIEQWNFFEYRNSKRYEGLKKKVNILDITLDPQRILLHGGIVRQLLGLTAANDKDFCIISEEPVIFEGCDVIAIGSKGAYYNKKKLENYRFYTEVRPQMVGATDFNQLMADPAFHFWWNGYRVICIPLFIADLKHRAVASAYADLIALEHWAKIPVGDLSIPNSTLIGKIEIYDIYNTWKLYERLRKVLHKWYNIDMTFNDLRVKIPRTYGKYDIYGSAIDTEINKKYKRLSTIIEGVKKKFKGYKDLTNGKFITRPWSKIIKVIHIKVEDPVIVYNDSGIVCFTAGKIDNGDAIFHYFASSWGPYRGIMNINVENMTDYTMKSEAFINYVTEELSDDERLVISCYYASVLERKN